MKTLTAIAEKNSDVMFITGDLGYSVFENFRDNYPNQYLNAGVAEQNMIGVAAGMAMSGRMVFVYSIIPFVTYRCLEQIRNDVCYHDLPVCVVGVGAGYSYGHMGSTHHALEDISIMRSLPNMTVICPGDPLEVEAATQAIYQLRKPTYLRLGKNGEPVIHNHNSFEFQIGKAIEMQKGNVVTIISTSTMLGISQDVTNQLTAKDISTQLLSMHTIKPIDASSVLESAKSSDLLVTIEEHSPIGGLGGAVSEILSKNSAFVRHLNCSAPDSFADVAGSQTFFLNLAQLTPKLILDKILLSLPSSSL